MNIRGRFSVPSYQVVRLHDVEIMRCCSYFFTKVTKRKQKQFRAGVSTLLWGIPVPPGRVIEGHNTGMWDLPWQEVFQPIDCNDFIVLWFVLLWSNKKGH